MVTRGRRLILLAVLPILVWSTREVLAQAHCNGQNQQKVVAAAVTVEKCTEAEASDAAAAQAGITLHCKPMACKQAGISDQACVRTTANMTCTAVANPAHGAVGHVHCPLKGGAEATQKWTCTVPATDANGTQGLCRCKSTLKV